MRATGSIDIACKFLPWLERVSAKAERVQTGLKLAARTAREEQTPLRGLLRNAADSGAAPPWLHTTLTSLMTTDFKSKSNTDDEACREVAMVMCGFVCLLEVHGGIDVESTTRPHGPTCHFGGFPWSWTPCTRMHTARALART